ERQFGACELVRPFRRSAYDPGNLLEYSITGVAPANDGRMVVEVDRFVGGGFAGQVYRVELVEIQADEGPISGLVVGQPYALKILKPPSAFARLFRDFLYFLAYQGRFSAQVNPASVRVGVLWQKLIRRAAAIEFGSDSVVCDTYATFYDEDLHSFGEINEWIDGRIWKYEVDDRLFERWDFRGPPPEDHSCPEYVHKKLFMRKLVALLHEMGAPELARQYEWWTCKSQPNALKRLSASDASPGGLTAVDFRAGLTLLPFLPMSPVDFRLIWTGLIRGKLVQFDRSDPVRFGKFVEERRDEFEDLRPAIEELQEQEAVHRASLPDVTHHHVHLITDGELRRSVGDGAITAWKNLGKLDDEHASSLKTRRGLLALLFLVSLVPLIGGPLVKLWGNARARDHARRCLTSFGYLWRAMRGARIETLVVWQREGRVCDERALRLVHRPLRYWLQRILLGWLPPTWHRFVAEPAYASARIRDAVGFAVRFLREPPFREEWLLEQVKIAQDEGMVSSEEASKIAEQIEDPFIQKYLKSIAVHICTLPVTQVVSLSVALYVMIRFGKSWGESLAYALATLAFFQLTPISPGSIARGSYVVYLVISERNLRNYAVALLVSFWKYIGYLGFPLQMVRQYPALSRLMAGRWAKGIVHVVPVFGESGGLLEHAVFDLFFNLPLSVKRAFKINPLRWAFGTVVVTSVLAACALGGIARVWEWSQPELELEGAKVASITPYQRLGGDLHWRSRGFRVRFEGRDGVVDYPARRWDESVIVGDTIDAVIRNSFFGDEYDGLLVTRYPLDAASRARPTSQREEQVRRGGGGE
ncbi:MAG: hypothetical protein ACFFEM_12970, partial [Candidatus Thorarchaeota archaeon]